MNNKWDAVFDDAEFAKSIIAMEPEQAQKALAERDFDFTMDEIIGAGKEIAELMQKAANLDELDEEALSEVSGGSISPRLTVILGLVGIIVCSW